MNLNKGFRMSKKKKTKKVAKKTNKKFKYDPQESTKRLPLVESKCPMCKKIHKSTARYKYCERCRHSKKFKEYCSTDGNLTIEVSNDFVSMEYDGI